MPQHTFAVFGATGAQGAPVVAALLAAGHRVRAVARDASAVHSRHGSGGAVEAVSADLGDAEQVGAALRGVAGAFAHLPIATAPDAPQRQLAGLLAGAAAARLPLLVYSTSGMAAERYRQSPFIAANAAATRAVLASGIPAIVLQPSLYAENLQSPALLPHLLSDALLDYPPVSSTRRIAWTTQGDQGRIAAAALVRPDLAGRAVEIATPGAVTGPELAALLTHYVGRPVRFQPATPDAFGAHLGRVFGSPAAGEGIADMYRALGELPPDGALVDTDALQALFGVRLLALGVQMAAWQHAPRH